MLGPSKGVRKGSSLCLRCFLRSFPRAYRGFSLVVWYDRWGREKSSVVRGLGGGIFRLFLKVDLGHELFVACLLLDSLVLVLASIFFCATSGGMLVGHTTLSDRRRLSLVADGLKRGVSGVSGCTVALSVGDGVTSILGRGPAIPRGALRRFLMGSRLASRTRHVVKLRGGVCT